MGIIRTTFEIITEESAEQGNAEEQGWEDEKGKEYDLAEAISLLQGCEPSATHFYPGVWYTSYGEMDMFSGNYENLSYHLFNFTEDEQRQIFQAVSTW